MDNQRFDRLAMAVSRLRDGATRRQALRAILGGALALPAVVAGGGAEAQRRRRDRDRDRDRDRWWDDNRWRCRPYGQSCNSSRQCCNGACNNGFCGINTNPGGNCRNTDCPDGWTCRKVANGIRICQPPGSTPCCNGSCWPTGTQCCRGGACGPGLTCCGTGTCCGSSFRCCGSTCCPTGSGWRCRNGTCELDVNARAAAGAGPVEPTPFDPSAGTPMPEGYE
jgi:hypothetical protein